MSKQPFILLFIFCCFLLNTHICFVSNMPFHIEHKHLQTHFSHTHAHASLLFLDVCMCVCARVPACLCACVYVIDDPVTTRGQEEEKKEEACATPEC